ncbi:NDMA-dependent alcohol dehydrogenase [Mycobacterium sp. 48b]|uniref:NDMA-dependent alcohol dehydrogenase n=1 Tax=Mycobacterium sp. 48b TaxID=3400426 RepID=UPI003AB09B36
MTESLAEPLKCRGAILRGVGMDWEIEEITLDPPRTGEVLVKMAVAGICHTDDHFTTGDMVPTPELVAMYEAVGVPPPDFFPMLGGHEGAGVVEAVGPGVRSVQPGDHVGLSFIAACGICRWCASGRAYLCDNGALMLAKEMVTDNTVRRHIGDEGLMAMTQLGTFAEYAVLAEESVIKLDESTSLEAASLVSCGVTTGWGSGTVGVGTEPGDTVVVVGIGGVGVNAVQGARAVGAKLVIAVDPIDLKRDTAKFFGATDTCPSLEAAIPLVRELTRGLMADRVVLTPSVVTPEMLAPALMLTGKGGTCLMTGVPKFEFSMVPMLLVDMLQNCKTFKGLIYGGMNPRVSMPMLLDMYRNGHLKLDELVTRRYRLDQINDAIADMREGRNIRGIIEFPQ